MAEVETKGSDKDLTVGETKQESASGSTEPAKDEDLPEDAKNWQHAIQQAREREKALKVEAGVLREKLGKAEAEEKRKQLADMSEAERYKSIAEEEAQKRGKLEMRQLILEGLADKKVPVALRELLLRSPWSIPAVEEELGQTYTWDEAISAVRRHLPAYIESITASESEPNTSSEEPIRKVDTERSTGSSVVKDHTYTQDEVNRLYKDPVEYEKHREKILRQMARNGGRL
jgi:regulator of replication initiation timing